MEPQPKRESVLLPIHLAQTDWHNAMSELDKDGSYTHDSGDTPSTPSRMTVLDDGFYDPSKESVWTRAGLTRESFKQAPGVTRGQVAHGDVPDYVPYDSPLLQQKMRPRHLQMIAVGGSIGTGLFIGSGAALRVGGPAGVLIAWIITGFMVLNVVQALGEMAIVFPVSGGFYTLSSRMLDPAFAFAVGTNYVLQWCLVLPLELTVASTTVQYWTNDVPLAVWITIFILVIIFMSILGTLGYAEEEFWSSSLKLLVAIIFILIGIVCICGGGPESGQYSTYIGGQYWHNPGSFANGFKGVCAVFVNAAFSYAGTEVVGLAATETPNPRKSMPTAVKQSFWRVIVLYVATLTVIGLAIPYDDPRLFGGSSDANLSPFVILMEKAHIGGMSHLINATICISVLSIGLTAVFAASRTLTALAENGYAPSIFKFVDKSGRPLWSVVFVLCFAPLAYINCADVGTQVFNWLMALTGLSVLLEWLSICITHVRFRRAWKVQGHSVEELPFRALGGMWGSVVSAVLIGLVIVAQFYIALWPVGGSESPGKAAEHFFLVFLCVPIVLGFWVFGYFWKRTVPTRANEIDLDTGRKSWLSVDEMRAYRRDRAAAPLYLRVWRFLFSN